MIRTRPLLISLLIPLAVGGAAALLTAQAPGFYEALVQPKGAPPSWVFPVVWTILYALMGYASYRVFEATDCPVRRNALTAYAAQLILNFFWPLFFFRLEAFGVSFVWLVLLIIAVALTVYLFFRCDRLSAYLLIPYLLWCLFAAYLNAGIWFLN